MTDEALVNWQGMYRNTLPWGIDGKSGIETKVLWYNITYQYSIISALWATCLIRRNTAVTVAYAGIPEGTETLID